MNENKIMGMLGLARRAGTLTFGFDSVKNAAISRKVYLILITTDISAKTAKECRFIADKYNLPIDVIHCNMSDLIKIAGKSTGVIAISDKNIAAELMNLLQHK